METFFFGPAQRQLYGIYHAPFKPRRSEEGVLLLYPLGQEYMRIHRAYRWLADRLSKLGFHVLRFDYSGQGNSAGEGPDFDNWLEDAVVAARELRSITAAERLSVIGCRIGATLATLLAEQTEIDRIALWEPRDPGQRFVDELHQQIQTGEWPLANFVAQDGTLHFNGFAFPPAFIDALLATTLSRKGLASASRSLAITSDSQLDLSEMLQDSQGNMKTECVFEPGPTDWNRVDGIGGVFLPQRILHVLCAWMDSP